MDRQEGLKEPSLLPSDAAMGARRDAASSDMRGGARSAFPPMMTALHAPRPSGGRGPTVTASNLLERLDLERPGGSATDSRRRAALGQFFTPIGVARFMASMLQVCEPPETLRILDPGGGSGILTAAAVAELCRRPERDRPASLHATVWELDERLAGDLVRTFDHCRAVCAKAGIAFHGEHRLGNFVLDAVSRADDQDLLEPDRHPGFHAAIMNPPYRKLRSDSAERSRMSAVGIETSNLYSAFVWLVLKLLADGGELVAITPRSFMNGSYFRPFRQTLSQELAFRRIHVYDARDAAFAEDGVLQENVIFHGVRGGGAGAVRITTSLGPADDGLLERTVEPDELILPHDPERVLHVVSDETDARIAANMRRLPHTLAGLGVSVSTGRVVGFRARERLRADAAPGDAPLILPGHCARGFVAWPNASGTKPNALTISGPDDDLLLPAGWYVLINRFSAKEDRRRVVASLYDPARIDAENVAFDNKLNVLHRGNAGLPEHLAKGFAMFLNSTAVDAYFRQFSGHTQVNAGDLRSLRFPSADVLDRLGRRVDGVLPAEERINRLVRQEIPEMSEGGDPIEVKERIDAAKAVLKALEAPKAQRNDRSALTLLGLLDLGPADLWRDASAPFRGVTELMDWMASSYGKRYAPNTRETIRRFTLHQFEQMGLVLLNPDDRSRPINSPKNVYQIEPGVLALLRRYGTDEWEGALAAWLASVEGNNRLAEQARAMPRIPLTLPDGRRFDLTPGGQNVLVREIIEEFAPRFTPGGRVVYVGDAGRKHLVYDERYLKNLGVEIDPHGKMPDVVIHHIERDWLVLVEAVTSHGPVNALRHNQLKDLFAGSSAGLVFVTAFLDRAAMRGYLPEIAWETEVWIADAPEHLIHFNGERFLGPHAGGG